MGDLLRPDRSVRGGPHHPAAAAPPALQTQRPLRGDHGRVVAGAAPHQVTERKRAGERAEGQRAEPVHARREGGGGRPTATCSAQL